MSMNCIVVSFFLWPLLAVCIFNPSTCQRSHALSVGDDTFLAQMGVLNMEASEPYLLPDATMLLCPELPPHEASLP